MKNRRNNLFTSIQTALSVGALATIGVAGNAMAQNTAGTQSQNQPKTLQTVVVTGSHIRRVDVETDNQVVAVTPQQITATGKMAIGNVISQLPVITGGIHRPTLNNGGGNGETLVGLRGLGPARTLILVNGQRLTYKDLNTIPTAAVQRVEVLTSGASAIYGSDAIGGVINFILKSHYQGAQFKGNYGISSRGDGQREGGSFTFGQTSDKGSLVAGVSYNKFKGVLQAARKFSKNIL
jgi:outer membrane receptor protein involved in Fe transport